MEPVPTRRWWQGRRGTNRVLILVVGLLAASGVVLAGTARLTAGDTRQVVATLRLPATDAERAQVRAGCGGLPGVAVVPDRGDPARQANLPVRFSISGSTQVEEAALYDCLDGFGDLVRLAAPESR